jgi:hypothetical protein
MPFFTLNPFRLTYFLPTAAKSKQKVPLEGNALHPIILRIKQVVCTCSRQWQTHLTSMLNALLNSQNNRRALSRGEWQEHRLCRQGILGCFVIY